MIRKHQVVKHGFSVHGWLTTVEVAGKTYQKFFPMRDGNDQPSKIWNDYQKKRAQYFDARWKSREAALQYRKFVTSSAADAGLKGVGVHGITLDITFEGSSNQYLCIFIVGLGHEIARVAVTHNRPFHKAWERAVRTWGTHFEIREKDILKTMLAPPNIDAFERLRVHLNQKRAEKIPSEATRVLQKRYRKVTADKLVKKRPSVSVEIDDVTSFTERLKYEINKFQRGRRRHK